MMACMYDVLLTGHAGAPNDRVIGANDMLLLDMARADPFPFP